MPHYDEDYICDCPYGVDMHPIGVCPPAEQIKDNPVRGVVGYET